jgi:hypothetical protein
MSKDNSAIPHNAVMAPSGKSTAADQTISKKRTGSECKKRMSRGLIPCFCALARLKYARLPYDHRALAQLF